MGPGEFVQVENIGDRAYDFRWDGRIYTAVPGKKIAMPFEAMVNECGDPRSAGTWKRMQFPDGTQGDIPPRHHELARLRTKHGGSGLLVNRVDDLPNRPVCRVTDYDGDPITTVLDDPAGETVNPATAQTVQQAADQAQLMAEQSRTIQALQGRLAAVEANIHLENEPGPQDEADVESDD